MSSINTNLSAMTALQSLKSTQNSLNKTQQQISTGLRVGGAADNASYWAISTKMKSDNGALGAVKDSIKQSVAMIDTFSKAFNNSIDYLNKLKNGLTAAMQPGANLDKIDTELQANISGLKSAGESASINGQNWLTDGSKVKLVASYNGQSGQVGTIDIDTSSMKMFTTDASGKFNTATGGILQDVVGVKLNSAAPTYGAWEAYSAKTDASGSLSSTAIGDLAQKMVKGGNKVEGAAVSGFSAVSADGSFKIKVGSDPADQAAISVTTADSMQDIVDAINGASGLSGKLTASLNETGDGIVLTATDPTKSITIGADDTAGATQLTLSDIGLTAGTTLGGSTGADPSVDKPAVGKDKVTVDANGSVTVEHVIQAGEDGTAGDLKKTTFEKSDVGGTTTWSMSVQTAKANTTAGTTQTAIQGFLDKVNAAIEKVTTAASVLGANKTLLESQQSFVESLSDSLTAGVSALVDADMNETSTRLQALQTQQQLGVQSLSIANQNSQMILKLFQ